MTAGEPVAGVLVVGVDAGPTGASSSAVNQKTVPPPGLGRSPISPPRASTISREIASPSPVPP